MTDKERYKDDLREIRNMMEQSSKFISLSGISGVFAGLFAIAGAYLAYRVVYHGQHYLSYRQAELELNDIILLLSIAVSVLVLSLTTAILFTTRKARKNQQVIWDHQVRRLLINLFIPLVTGGVFCLILVARGYIGLIAPLTLIFYGLALVNASKYTLSEIRALGIIEILLGLLATYFIGYGLLFWAIGFGILHILYGILMHIKYGS